MDRVLLAAKSIAFIIRCELLRRRLLLEQLELEVRVLRQVQA